MQGSGRRSLPRCSRVSAYGDMLMDGGGRAGSDRVSFSYTPLLAKRYLKKLSTGITLKA